jgi:phosphoribosylanthranilate isomerase
VFVKICGITNLKDALAAIDAGAQALGFVFVEKSPRCVKPEQLTPWIGQIPSDIWKVGVFVNESPARMEAMVDALGLDVVQLHGQEPPSQLPRALRIWKAARVGPGFDAASLTPYAVEGFLLDGPGHGKPFDWSLASAPGKMILAGGLDAGNVRRAIDSVKPWGVDACSLLERAPGRKDHRKVAEFIEAALRL